jgi:uncharacterized membrane protein
MKITRQSLVVIGLLFVAFIISIYYYPQMPQSMASHWNALGEVDGYCGKNVGLFILPCVMAGMAALLYFIPYLDPLKRNIEKFRPYYEHFIVFMCVFMLAIHYHVI